MCFLGLCQLKSLRPLRRYSFAIAVVWAKAARLASQANGTSITARPAPEGGGLSHQLTSVLAGLAPLRREEVHYAYRVVVDLIILGLDLPYGVFLRLGHDFGHHDAGYNDQRGVKVVGWEGDG